MLRTRFIGLVALFALVSVAVRASSSRDALVVTPAWLAEHLRDANLVVLHAGDKAEYDARHVPGARFVALDDIALTDREGKTDGLSLQVPAADDLRARLSALGISDGSRIVVYPAARTLTSATRVLFTLDYAGLGDRASLLDGGLDGWVKAGHEVTKDVPAPKTGTLAPLKIRAEVVDAAYVLAHLQTPKVAIVDARAPAFFDGAQTGNTLGRPHATGHIPGARNVPYTQIVDEQGNLKPAEQLAALFHQAGVQDGDTIVGYCHIGQQASAMLFAARTLGFGVVLYDGSFEDWSRRPGYPVEIKKDSPGVDLAIPRRLR